MKRLLVIGIFGWIVALSTTANAQTSAELQLHMTYTDNVFQTASKQSDWLTQAAFDFGYAPNRNMQLYYTGGARIFTDTPDLFNHGHTLGIVHQIASSATRALWMGLEGSTRLDKPLYQHYDYLQADAYTTGKVNFSNGLRTNGGYRLRIREYTHLGDYSYLEQQLFGQLSRSWQTGTTVQLRTNLGVKTYLRDNDYAERTLTQLELGGKFAQALALRTGLQIAYTHRLNLSGNTRAIDETLLTDDEDPFYDRYSYEGQDLRAVVKYMGLNGIRVELTGQIAWRHYTNRLALDLDGFEIAPDMMRDDTRKSFGLEIEKTIPISQAIMQSLHLYAETWFLDTASNDPYYDVPSRYYSVGLSLDF